MGPWNNKHGRRGRRGHEAPPLLLLHHTYHDKARPPPPSRPPSPLPSPLYIHIIYTSSKDEQLGSPPQSERRTPPHHHHLSAAMSDSPSSVDIAQLSDSQRAVLEQFIAVTAQSPIEAIPLLRRSQWNVQVCLLAPSPPPKNNPYVTSLKPPL